jgi:hypothetical protein
MPEKKKEFIKAVYLNDVLLLKLEHLRDESGIKNISDFLRYLINEEFNRLSRKKNMTAEELVEKILNDRKVG